jgi:hypothetical protein
MTDDDVIGYGAVIVSDLNQYQGFFIRDNEAIRAVANELIRNSVMAEAEGFNRFGALQAAAVEAVLSDNQPLLGAAALALVAQGGHHYFVIHGVREPEGTRTTLVTLHSNTVDEARDEINNSPLIKSIQRRLLDEVTKNPH